MTSRVFEKVRLGRLGAEVVALAVLAAPVDRAVRRHVQLGGKAHGAIVSDFAFDALYRGRRGRH